MMSKILMVLFFLAIQPVLSAQNPFGQSYHIKSENDVDSVFELIDFRAEQLRKGGSWDSLVFIKTSKAELSEAWENVDIWTQRVKEAEHLADSLLEESSPAFLHAKNVKAHWLIAEHEFQKSIDMSDKVLVNAEKGNVQFAKSVALVQKAFSLLNLTQIQKAEHYAKEALISLKSSTADTARLVQAYQILAYANMAKYNFEEALQYYLDILELNSARFGRDHYNVGIDYMQIAQLHSNTENYQKALTYYLKAQDIFSNFQKRTGNSSTLIILIYNLGILYRNMGEYSLTTQHLLYGLDLCQKQHGKNSALTLKYYHFLTEVYIKQNDAERAKYYNNLARSALTNSKELKTNFSKVIKEDELNILMLENKFQKADSLHDFITDKYEYALLRDTITMYTNYFKIEAGMGNLRNANEYLTLLEKESLKLFGPTHHKYYQTLANKLDFYVKNKDAVEVELVVNTILNSIPGQKGNTKFSNLPPNQSLLEILITYSKYLSKRIDQDDYTIVQYKDFIDDFEKYYENHLNLVQSNTRLSKEGEELKKIYAPLLQHAFTNNDRELILYAEKLKAILTKVILQNRVLGDVKNVNKNFSVAKEILSSYQDTISEELYRQMFENIATIQIYKDSLYRNDKIKFNQLFNIENPTLDQIQNTLQENELLIEYIKVDSIMYCMKYRKGKIEYHKMNYNDLEQKVLEYHKNRNDKSSKELYELLLSGTFADRYDKWLISPDGILYNLNFEELKSSNDAFVIETKKIRYAYSVGTLLFQDLIDENLQNRNDILSFTPGFSNAFREKFSSDSIYHFFLRQPFLIRLTEELRSFPKATILNDIQATETNYKTFDKNYKIIHFGTHGLINDQSPQFSRFILTKDSLEDGMVHAYELYGQQMNTNLAVLASCSSGKGHRASSEGLVSITHAFTHAQCPSVLMTLWDVDEKTTADILSQFYRNIRRGQLKSEALRNAKMDFIKKSDGVLQDPYYWSGIVIIGSDVALYPKSNLLIVLIIASLLAFVVFAFYMSKTKAKPTSIFFF